MGRDYEMWGPINARGLWRRLVRYRLSQQSYPIISWLQIDFALPWLIFGSVLAIITAAGCCGCVVCTMLSFNCTRRCVGKVISLCIQYSPWAAPFYLVLLRPVHTGKFSLTSFSHRARRRDSPVCTHTKFSLVRLVENLAHQLSKVRWGFSLGRVLTTVRP